MNAMGFLTDLRFAARQFAAKPGFAAAAILTLALGIGASATVFDVLSGYLLKSLPYPQAQQLVKVDAWLPQIRPEPFPASLPYFRVIQQQAASFSASAVYDLGDFNLNPGDHARRVAGVTASASLFAVLGTQPLLGHAFTPRNTQPGNERVVVISWQLWHDAFAGSPRAVGTDVAIEGDRYRIIGVMPRGFAFPDRSVGLWMPLAAPASGFAPDQALSLGWNLIGRLKPGVSIPVAEQRIQRTITNWNRDHLPANLRQILQGSELVMQVQSWRSSLLADRSVSLWILQAAALLVLLITCVNVANLLLSRILGRSHEIALRSTLGATRSMLARQLLGEALCLAVPGGLAGIGLCWLTLSFLARSPLGSGESVFDLGLDWRVGLFVLGTVLFTAMLVSILPIRHLVKTDLQLLLQQGGRSAGGGRKARRTRNLLAVAELTLAAGLLAVAGLLLHSFLNLQAVDPGFRRDHVLIAGLLIAPTDHAGDKALRKFYGNLVRRVDAMPGVENSGVAEYLPLGGAAASGFRTFSILGKRPLVKGQPRTAIFNTVSPGVFAALGIPILRGRAFDARDEGTTRAIIGERVARQYFHGADPIGQTVVMGGMQHLIIGVVPTLKYASLGQSEASAVIYVYGPEMPPTRHAQLVIHTELPPQALVKPLQGLLARVDPDAAVYDVHTMREQVSRALGDRQTTMVLLLVFGAIALALAIIGVYAVMSYAVGQRRAECGIRLALGATPGKLRWLLLKDGLMLLVAGLGIGVALAVLFGKLLAARLFDIAPWDPLSLIGAIVVLTCATLAACYLPARRMAKLNPATAILEE